jgi:hypothetical protein
VHIANEFVQCNGDDAFARGKACHVGWGMLGKERCSHTHDRKCRDLSNRATNFFEDDANFGESETGATIGFGHPDTDNAKVSEFTPESQIDTFAVFDLLEVFHRATVGEHAADQPAQFFLV